MPTITNPKTADGTNIPNCGMAFNIAREVAELVGTPILIFPPPTTLAVGITVPLAIATVSPSQRARGQGRKIYLWLLRSYWSWSLLQGDRSQI